MKYAVVAFSLAAIVGLAGCASNAQPRPVVVPHATFADAAANEFIKSSRDAISRLVAGLDTSSFSPVLVATVVDVNDLRQAKPLGRTLSEQYATSLVASGFAVKEMKLRGDVFVRETTGELMLSREVQDIARVHNATTVLVGTYSVASQFTFVSLKLVSTSTGQIVRAYDYALPNNADVRALLR